MGENSEIQWTTHTFNPWIGCEKVSPGCKHCYAEALDKRMGGARDQRVIDETKHLRWGPGSLRTRTTPSNWSKPIGWDFKAKQARVRHRVFCASLADVFEKNARFDLDLWRLELFELIRRTPNLDWLLLTKRPENVLPMLSAAQDRFGVTGDVRVATVDMLQDWVDGVPPANVWLGTTVEDQQHADLRIPSLLKVPARVRFLSMEPLLESVALPDDAQWIDWLIVGGESGGGARPFNIAWARQLVAAGRALGIATFVKQLGARPVINETDWRTTGRLRLLDGSTGARTTAPKGTLPLKMSDSHGGEITEFPEDLQVREFPHG